MRTTLLTLAGYIDQRPYPGDGAFNRRREITMQRELLRLDQIVGLTDELPVANWDLLASCVMAFGPEDWRQASARGRAFIDPAVFALPKKPTADVRSQRAADRQPKEREA